MVNEQLGTDLKLVGNDIVFDAQNSFTFISDEATLYLKEWLKIHDSYLQAACNRLNIPGKTLKGVSLCQKNMAKKER